MGRSSIQGFKVVWLGQVRAVVGDFICIRGVKHHDLECAAASPPGRLRCFCKLFAGGDRVCNGLSVRIGENVVQGVITEGKDRAQGLTFSKVGSGWLAGLLLYNLKLQFN